jgi:hypothetical protein
MMITSPLWMLILCVCPGARKTCVFELLLVPILDLDLSRGCAADLGTSRWRNLVADCDLERQTAKCGRDASSARCCAARLRSRSGVWSCCRPRVVVLVAAETAEASLRGSPCRIVSIKISTQGVNRPTTYPKYLHVLADETYSSLNRMEVCGGCGWQMRHARGGWLHARCEGKNRRSARPGQYALPCTNELLNNIPKQLCSHAMKLVVLFGRCALCVVAWCEKCCCCGGGGGSPLWLASDGRLSCAAKS